MIQFLKRHIVQILKLYFFWFVLFAFMRVLFSIIYLDKLTKSSFTEWLGIFYHSLRLDLAMASILMLPLLIWLIVKPLGIPIIKWIFIVWQIIAVAVCCIIHSAEINVYSEWNHKLTSRVFTHLSNPNEVFRTAEYSQILLFALYLTLELQFARIIWKKLFKGKFFQLPTTLYNWKEKITFSFVSILFLCASAIAVRGGLQPIPININSAMFSNRYVINDLSVNSTYFFAKSYLLYNKTDIIDLYPEISEEERKNRVSALYDYARNQGERFLKTTKPNVVVVLLESWTSNAIGALSSVKGATPVFDSLTKDGYLFSNVYACGGTSEIGNASIFSGYPAIPEVSITMHPEKSRTLPSINQDLERVGYSTGYVFSGDLKYGNIGGYLLDHGFQDLKDENDFPSHLSRGKLNYYDKDLYQFLMQRINSTKEPFLHCAFTGSTHSPFDQPKTGKQNWQGNEAKFMNSLIYADEQLREFLKNAQKEEWYKNTLFVFVADHGHMSPIQSNPSDINFFKIPLLFYGDVLKEEFKGKRNTVLASQADFAATLLYQMDISNKGYPWSRNLMNPNIKPYVLHTVAGGYGYRSKEGTYCYQMENDYVIKDSISEEGKRNSYAIINALYYDFLTQ